MTNLLQFLKFMLMACSLLQSLVTTAQEKIQQHPADSAHIQAFQRVCSNDIILRQLRQDKQFRQREDRMNREIQQYSRQLADDTLIIPVVIHIINPDPFSITDQTVINGINDLNDAFSKSGVYAASLGVDTKIRFCIAKEDPEGGVTTGITRTHSFFGSNLNMDTEDDKLKNLIQWDPVHYMNIWLINNINAEAYAAYSCGTWTRLGVTGYATLPPGGTALDGIVITGFGTLLTHETGHYLGLYHTFEGGCNNNNCETDGDRVCDTPPDGSLNPSFGGCTNPDNSCYTDTLSNYSNGAFPKDVPDQISNFMDYGNGACTNRFTQGQADRMRATILTQRPGLLDNKCAPPCTELINAAFTRDTAYTAAGESVTFTNTSTGATNFTWFVNDIVRGSGNIFSFTFDTIGKYKITLRARNADTACYATAVSYVIVNCGVTARFITDKKLIASILPLYPDSIRFTNTSFKGQTYQWLIGNDMGMTEQVVSTAVNLVYTFPVPGNYTIRLIATNGTCTDTSNIYRVPVQDPTADGVPVVFNAYCFQQTRIKLSFCIDNYGFAPLPANTPVTFYDKDPRLPGATKLSPTFYLPYQTAGGNCRYCFYDHILDIPYAGLNQVYVVFNDAGTTSPLVLPNATLPEKNYLNNVAVISNLRFQVTATPATATLLPGDTLQLTAQASPPVFPASTYLWSDAYKLSCTTCNNPLLYADSDRVKMVIATSEFGCIDTAYITIKVPPADDYTVRLDTAICVSKDKMTVNFTLYNQFFRGVIPKDLKLSFYNGDPKTPGAVLLKPVFSVPDTVKALQASFSATIEKIPEGNLYAVVNDSSVIIPVSLPNTPKLEKIYTNNFDNIIYKTTHTVVDTTICDGGAYFGYNTTGTFTDTLNGYNGCDSIRTVNLTVNPVFKTAYDIKICQGEIYAGHTTTGTYVDVYTATNGCDSTRTLTLTVNPIYNTTVDTVLCQDESYAGYTTTGRYVDLFTSINGCDSTRTLNLVVNPKQFITINPEICAGESFFAGGKLQTTTGIYYDTFRTYLGCDSVKTTNLTVHENPVPNLGADRGICLDGTYTLSPGNFTSYLWSNGATSPTYTTNVLGNYGVTVTNIFGCKGSDTILLNGVLPLPTDFLPPDTSLCLGNVLRLNVPGYKTYVWSTGSTASSIDVTKNGTYRLQVTDQFDCTGTDSLKVSFYADCIIFEVPNAFSPNGDNRNETFKPYLPAPVTDYTMRIYNRLGQMVFESHVPAVGWDGTFKGNGQDPATFVYYITLKDYRGETRTRRGTVVLIR